VFEDHEWPAFKLSVQSTIPPRSDPFRWWYPDDKSYLDFAAKSMTAPNNVKIAKHYMKTVAQTKMNRVLDRMKSFTRQSCPKLGLSC